MKPHRPESKDPLKDVPEDKAGPPRAKLKIFFGMAPGVGKTHTMLKVARELREEGVEIVIGVVETHGREETAALTQGFETLPKRTLPYRGLFLEEFDLKAAIERKPQLLLMDELAHTNVQGSLHQKRWQDVWDLLDAGIDVYTTVNVQHIESLKDVVAQITGLIVQENIPDTILNRADEIEIVDIPPDDLIQRLKEGKVYMPDQARHAVDRFFRKGNLLALRELALRRVAEHVDADMRRYMSSQGIDKTWAAGERLLVCISSRPESSRLIRSTKRMAEAMDAPWIAVYVENARGMRHSAADRARLEEHLRLAERLGGETVVMQGGVHIAQDLINLAVSRNVSKILIGKPRKSRWIEFFTGSLLAELVRRSGDIDVLVMTGEVEEGEAAPAPVPIRTSGRRVFQVRHILWAALAVAVATAVGLPISRTMDLPEIVMVYVLAILAVGLRFGRFASLAASILSAVALDFVFIPPAFSFAVEELRHMGTFASLLVVGYIIGGLVERVHAQTRLARSREQRVLALFRLTGELARVSSSAKTVETSIQAVAKQFQSQITILLPDAQGRLHSKGAGPAEELDPKEFGVAQWAFDHREPAGLGTDILPGAKSFYQPLMVAKGILGVMGIQPDGASLESDHKHLLEAFANQTALALERAILAESSQSNRERKGKEQLCDALLSVVSMHLQPILDGMERSAMVLAGEGDSNVHGPASAFLGETRWMRNLLSNLTTMAHLESGMLQLRKERLPLAQVVETALKELAPRLEDRSIKVELPANLPKVDIDRSLLEQVLVNLLDNARAFSPADSPIEVKGWATERAVTLAITDHGPGIPEGQEERVFERPSGIPEGGAQGRAKLGLALCKGIVEAHGGWIQAGNRPAGGAQILLSLPLEPTSTKAPVEDLLRG